MNKYCATDMRNLIVAVLVEDMAFLSDFTAFSSQISKQVLRYIPCQFQIMGDSPTQCLKIQSLLSISLFLL